jgi:magnesium-transporting ATPase (P-type)
VSVCIIALLDLSQSSRPIAPEAKALTVARAVLFVLGSGEISKERYEEKHGQFMKQKAEIESQLTNIDASMSERLEQRLVILELSQKAADLYAKKTPEQKRLIISKLFENLTLKGGVVSVKYSKFTEAIADKVQKTRNLLEA